MTRFTLFAVGVAVVALSTPALAQSRGGGSGGSSGRGGGSSGSSGFGSNASSAFGNGADVSAGFGSNTSSGGFGDTSTFGQSTGMSALSSGRNGAAAGLGRSSSGSNGSSSSRSGSLSGSGNSRNSRTSNGRSSVAGMTGQRSPGRTNGSFGMNGMSGGFGGLGQNGRFSSRGIGVQQSIRPVIQIALDLPPSLASAEIAMAANTSLQQSQLLGGLPGLRVNVDNLGVATVRGNAVDNRQGRIAAAMLSMQPGIRSVKNEISPPTNTTAPSNR